MRDYFMQGPADYISDELQTYAEVSCKIIIIVKDLLVIEDEWRR